MEPEHEPGAPIGPTVHAQKGKVALVGVIGGLNGGSPPADASKVRRT